MAQVFGCSQLQANPSLVAANKHLRALLRLCGRVLLCVSVHADTQTNGTDCEGDGLQVVALGSLGGVFAKALRAGLAQSERVPMWVGREGHLTCLAGCESLKADRANILDG